jgi:hypothetical protein
MNAVNRGTIVVGTFLIAIGAIFLILNLIPGLNAGLTWPIIFFILAAGFFLPAFLWTNAQRGLSGLFIPGAILLVLGLIFTYDVVTQDWVSWAYAWLLIPGSVGLGLWLGSTVGGWGKSATQTGLWMMGVCAALFAVFATIFATSDAMRLIGPLVIILAGVLVLFRVFRK